MRRLAAGRVVLAAAAPPATAGPLAGHGLPRYPGAALTALGEQLLIE
jgi:hypothetical protein